MFLLLILLVILMILWSKKKIVDIRLVLVIVRLVKPYVDVRSLMLIVWRAWMAIILIMNKKVAYHDNNNESSKRGSDRLCPKTLLVCVALGHCLGQCGQLPLRKVCVALVVIVTTEIRIIGKV